ncbi:hypothetical protein CTI14_07620 [Methylobacterium radiotolerans]|nr:hypothetical protein CTI14_07620 [Methylobacterium radiotolerans]
MLFQKSVQDAEKILGKLPGTGLQTGKKQFVAIGQREPKGTFLDRKIDQVVQYLYAIFRVHQTANALQNGVLIVVGVWITPRSKQLSALPSNREGWIRRTHATESATAAAIVRSNASISLA